MGFANSFALQNEHEQACAAYRTAMRILVGYETSYTNLEPTLYTHSHSLTYSLLNLSVATRRFCAWAPN